MLRALAFWLFVGTTAQACHGKAPVGEQKNSAGVTMTEPRIRTDIEGLANLINLPSNPKSVRWERQSAHGGGSSLIALLEIQVPEIQAILKASERLDVQSPFAIDVETARLMLPSRFPIDESDGSVRLKGINIGPSFFVNEKKSGLLNGKAVVVASEGLIFLSLYEM